jgi:hypothetical protein
MLALLSVLGPSVCATDLTVRRVGSTLGPSIRTGRGATNGQAAAAAGIPAPAAPTRAARHTVFIGQATAAAGPPAFGLWRARPAAAACGRDPATAAAAR